MAIQPVFLFSISRSGSTLVQRVMAAHQGVATVSEPWLLLPLAYTLRERGVDAEYLHAPMVQALGDFCTELPGGRREYEAALRELALKLYARAAPPGTTHFLDKSPPYCLVAEEIMRVFPDARFVFLWRNPLSIAASMIDTWGPWRPTMFREDLFVGLPRLVDTYARHEPAVHAVRYEQLISGDQAPWRELMRHVGVRFDPRALDAFARVSLNGRMGDQAGTAAYGALSSEPLSKWHATMANRLRREWCRRYLFYLGRSRLDRMGYDLELLLQDLDGLPRTFAGLRRDAVQTLVDLAKEPVRVRTRNRRLGSPNVIRMLLARASAPSEDSGPRYPVAAGLRRPDGARQTI